MSACHNYDDNYTRRDFLTKTSMGLGALTLANLMNPVGSLANRVLNASGNLEDVLAPHFPAKAAQQQNECVATPP